MQGIWPEYLKLISEKSGITFEIENGKFDENADLTYDELSPEVMASNSLIINATPLGTSPAVEQCPDIPYELLTSGHFLFDLVYNPLTTRFMELGAEQGAATLSGIDMLYAQAESAWEIWSRD